MTQSEFFPGPKSLFVFWISGDFLVKYLLGTTVTSASVSTLKLTFLPLTRIFACHGSWSSRELTEAVPLYFALFLDRPL